jgi:hypothetical protein
MSCLYVSTALETSVDRLARLSQSEETSPRGPRSGIKYGLTLTAVLILRLFPPKFSRHVGRPCRLAGSNSDSIEPKRHAVTRGTGYRDYLVEDAERAANGFGAVAFGMIISSVSPLRFAVAVDGLTSTGNSPHADFRALRSKRKVR